MPRSVMSVIGFVLVVCGGVILAVMAGATGTGLGTTIALAGLVLLGWAWLARSMDSDEES